MSETDRELLEWAAKAAGLGEVWYLEGSDTPYVGPRYVMGQPISYKTFKPLTDDGDAFRLAVALGLSIEPYPYHSMPKHSVIVKQRTSGGLLREANPTEALECYRGDPGAATRRAVTRSAAQIGKTTSEGK